MTRSRKRSIGGVIAGTSLGILAVAAVVLAAQGTIAFQQREDRPDRPNAITTTVRNEQLVDSVRADARAVPEHTWTVEAEGTVTRPGARAGQLVESGSVLAVVDERPLFLLDGSVPMYRSLAPGAVGSDVEQLQIALAALGYYNYCRERDEMTLDVTHGVAFRRLVVRFGVTLSGRLAGWPGGQSPEVPPRVESSGAIRPERLRIGVIGHLGNVGRLEPLSRYRINTQAGIFPE